MMNPEAEGARAAMRLQKIELHREKLKRHRAERELASLRIEMEELCLWLAKKHSQGQDVPVSLTIRQFENWLVRRGGDMRCYDGCPDRQLQEYLDSRARAKERLKAAGFTICYFPMEGAWVGFKDLRPVTDFLPSPEAVSKELIG